MIERQDYEDVPYCHDKGQFEWKDWDCENFPNCSYCEFYYTDKEWDK